LYAAQQLRTLSSSLSILQLAGGVL